MLLTRTLQKRNSTYYPIILALAVLSGCANQGATLVSPEQNKAETTSETLSAKTVVPVGFEKFMGIFTPYRVTIQQGNFVSKEMVAQVKEGMTREQVRFLLGTALLTDMFHADRWDYVFRLLKPNGVLITSRVTVFFQNNLVSKVEFGDLPDEKEYLAEITGGALDDASGVKSETKLSN